MNIRTHARRRKAAQLVRSTHADRGWTKLSDFKASIRGQARAGTPVRFGDSIGSIERVALIIDDTARTC